MTLSDTGLSISDEVALELAVSWGSEAREMWVTRVLTCV